MEQIGGKSLLLPVIPGKIEQYRDVCCNGIFVKKHVGAVLKNNRKRPGALYLETPLLLPSIWVHLCNNQAHQTPGVYFLLCKLSNHISYNWLILLTHSMVLLYLKFLGFTRLNLISTLSIKGYMFKKTGGNCL